LNKQPSEKPKFDWVRLIIYAVPVFLFMGLLYIRLIWHSGDLAPVHAWEYLLDGFSFFLVGCLIIYYFWKSDSNWWR
jgi:hypothetical protein